MTTAGIDLVRGVEVRDAIALPASFSDVGVILGYALESIREIVAALQRQD